MRRHKWLPARGKGGSALSCAGPGLKGSRERASAEGLVPSRPPLGTPRPRPPCRTSAPPQGPKEGIFSIWSNKKYKFYKRIIFRSMFSLESWPEGSNHCKTAAEIPYIMLENPSKNAAFFDAPAAVRGGIVYSSVSGCGERGLYANLLRSHDDFQQIRVSWKFCSAHAASRQNRALSIEYSSKIRSVRFPLGLLPKSRILMEGGAALALRN